MDDTDVSPELDWCEPPLCVLWEYSQDHPHLRMARPQPGDIFACGESSQERQEREAYRHLHPHLDFGPGEIQVLPSLALLPHQSSNIYVWVLSHFILKELPVC